MTELEQLQQLGDLGVEFAGMIFYHKSPRFVLRTLTGAQVKRAKLKVYKVGVFVNASYDEIINHVENFGLDMVQLHGDETPKFCEKVSDYISVIKAFRITDDDNIPWMVKDYVEAVDMYMFDTMGAGYGGTGKKFNWNMLKGLNIGKPFFLSGGIGLDEVAQIKEITKSNLPVYALDLNSKFEIEAGLKNSNALKQFQELLKQ